MSSDDEVNPSGPDQLHVNGSCPPVIGISSSVTVFKSFKYIEPNEPL